MSMSLKHAYYINVMGDYMENVQMTQILFIKIKLLKIFPSNVFDI